MKPKTQDERFNSIARGQVARLVHGELGNIISVREGQIMNLLVSYFRSNKLTHEMALAGIAGISELRGLMGQLDKEIKEGLEASNLENNQNNQNAQAGGPIEERYSEGEF